MKLALGPQDAWQPLPAREWNEDAARHLLRRVGWSAPPAEVARALQDGLAPTLERLFPAALPPMPLPAAVAALEEDTPDFVAKVRAAAPAERREILQQAREKSRNALLDLTIRWLQYARAPAHAVAEKWTLFLGNVYVVAAQKVQNTALLFRHQDLLRRHGMGPAPALTKAVLRSPAMIIYLDLQQSRNGAPNENFARELMELFTLGLGYYTENDIKQAARAFTGYVQRQGEFYFVPRLHDPGAKTVFGRTGPYDGDEVIDLIYEQPAAGTHLPARLTHCYLTADPLPDGYLEALGDWWRGTGFNLRRLALGFFSSRLFFDPQFRGASIKSPVQYYLGLLQDFALNVPPLPRRLVPAFRQMGQMPYDPPNVRGWVGGRDWISSTTLEARRTVARSLFLPFDEARLNADEQQAVAAARAEGLTTFTVDNGYLDQFAGLPPAEVAARLLRLLLPLPVEDGYRRALVAALRGGDQPAHSADQQNARLRNAIVTVLETPEYQLC
jgi:uncharacterized protein (DUF1800 family)